MNKTAIKILTIAAALTLVACTGVRVGAENQTDARIIDLKITASPIAWIDNETVLLIEESSERVDKHYRYHLVALNYRTGARRVYGRADQQICYSADGYISYINSDGPTGDIYAVYGPLGKETIHKFDRSEGFSFDRGPTGSCRPYPERPTRPAWLDKKTHFWPLWPLAGFIDCQAADVTARERYINARFHKPDDPKGVPLPFSCYQVFGGLKYYAFKGAYFAFEHDFRHPWPRERDRRVFWLYPDGRVETLVLPFSNAIRENGIPTARGLIAFARPTKRGDDYWIYLVTPEASKVVLRGAGSGVTSPDGCKVAMLHDPEFDARVDKRRVTTEVTLKVLELCEGK
jgi:hypothetical protein